MRILDEMLAHTRMRYLNISWCRLTVESTDALSHLITENPSLEKLLMQHNDQGSPNAIKLLINALHGHPSMKYLDISANKVQSGSFI